MNTVHKRERDIKVAARPDTEKLLPTSPYRVHAGNPQCFRLPEDESGPTGDSLKLRLEDDRRRDTPVYFYPYDEAEVRRQER